MSYYIVADGTTLQRGEAQARRVRAITPLSETRTKIDVTSLENTAVRTYLISNISETGDVTVTMGLKDAMAMAAQKGNSLWTITFPEDGGTITFWGDILSTTPSALEVATEAMVDLVIGTTNLNDAEVETPPVWPVTSGGVSSASTPLSAFGAGEITSGGVTE